MFPFIPQGFPMAALAQEWERVHRGNRGGQASSQRAGGWQAMQAKSNAVLKAAHKEMQGTAVFIVYILM